jgi:hypothetical protein
MQPRSDELELDDMAAATSGTRGHRSSSGDQLHHGRLY